jgi:pimeloyl-ACP methyl ester carboxylesterase
MTGVGRMLIDVGGYRMHIACAGEGAPLVVLESGAQGTADTWASVQPEVARFARVCAFDRPGVGRSEARPGPRIAVDTLGEAPTGTVGLLADELHALLGAADGDDPVVLVGHSFAGFTARAYAHRYAGRVAGLVLVDAPHESFFAPFFELLTEEQRRLERRWLPSERVLDDVRTFGPLGDLPLAVVTGGTRGRMPADRPSERIWALWCETQERLARLSSRSAHTSAVDSGHDVPREAPGVVVDAVRWVVGRRAPTWR